MHYSASKAALNSLIVLLAKELAPPKVRMNGDVPEPIDTGLQSRTSDEEGRSIIDNVPPGRFASSNEVAGSILLVLSDASYIRVVLDLNIHVLANIV